MGRKGNPPALLVGMKIDTATMEDGMEIPKKLRIKLPYDPAIPLLGIYPEIIIIEKDIYTYASLQNCLQCQNMDAT